MPTDVNQKIELLLQEQQKLRDRISSDTNRLNDIETKLGVLYEQKSNQQYRAINQELKNKGVSKAEAYFADEKNRIEYLTQFDHIRYRYSGLKPISLIKCLSSYLKIANILEKAYRNHLLNLFIDGGYIKKSEHYRGEWVITLDMNMVEFEVLKQGQPINESKRLSTAEVQKILYDKIIKTK